jgi:transposase
VGPYVDPNTGFARPAYALVMTLSFSRHQYAELVFDQKIPTWLALHRRRFRTSAAVWGG